MRDFLSRSRHPLVPYFISYRGGDCDKSFLLLNKAGLGKVIQTNPGIA